MTLMRIRIELARSHESPAGSSRHGYILTLPLDDEGRFDLAAFERIPEISTVHRFWEGEGDEVGQLMRIGADRWAFSYRIGTVDDEAIPRLAEQVFRPGEYISVREPDGRMLPFRVVEVRPAPGLAAPAIGRR
jgi:hypothetical protein